MHVTPAIHARSTHSNSRTRVIHLTADGQRAICGKPLDADRTAAYLAGDGITTKFDTYCAACREPAAPRTCPGVSGPVCGNDAVAGDRYCDGCRAEFDAAPTDGGW